MMNPLDSGRVQGALGLLGSAGNLMARAGGSDAPLSTAYGADDGLAGIRRNVQQVQGAPLKYKSFAPQVQLGGRGVLPAPDPTAPQLSFPSQVPQI